MRPGFFERLAESDLFGNHSGRDLLAITDGLRYRISEFDRGSTLAVEGAPCSHVGVILKGEVEIQNVLASGRTVTIDRLSSGQVFGEALIFSDRRRYPATVTAVAKTAIMYIGRGEIVRLCREDTVFLERFLGLLSGKILMLNGRLRDLSHGSIRQKIASRLLDLSAKCGSHRVDLGVSRREMAEDMGVPRPSLSRELVRMRRDGLIDFRGEEVTLLDPGRLEDVLFE